MQDPNDTYVYMVRQGIVCLGAYRLFDSAMRAAAKAYLASPGGELPALHRIPLDRFDRHQPCAVLGITITLPEIQRVALRQFPEEWRSFIDQQPDLTTVSCDSTRPSQSW